MPGTYIPSDYLPILIFMAIATAFAVGSLAVGILFRPSRPYPEKLSPYESGNIPIGEPRHRFKVSFYVVAMLFVIFDVEAIFLYPWAIVFDRIGLYAFVEMVLFIAVLLVGYVYAWRKDAFTWEI
jgi:NADH-quinone oxidoreductase subunit A